MKGSKAERQQKDAIKTLKKRPGSKSPKIQLLLLFVLETLSKNYGENVFQQIIEREEGTWHEAFGGRGGRGSNSLNQRKGDKKFTANIQLEMNYMPGEYKLSLALMEVLGIEVDTRSRIIAAIWHYVKTRKRFHLSPPQPVHLEHKIKLSGNSPAGNACYDVLVDVPFPVQRELNALLATTEKSKDIEACDETICTSMRKNNEHRKRQAFFLGFSQSPAKFIDALVESQGKDLKLASGETSRNIEKEHQACVLHSTLEYGFGFGQKPTQAQESSKLYSEKANEAEKEVLMLKETLCILQVEKELGLTKQMEYLKTISDLEENIRGMEKRAFEAEGEARTFSQQAAQAEMEIEKLKNALSELTEEKQSLQVLYAECLEKSYKLELDLSSAQSYVQRLTTELFNSTQKLKTVEEICVRLESSYKSLKIEASDLDKRIMLKDQELSDKHDGMEEHTHYVQVEAALETLQMLHTRSQEEQRNLALELKNGLQMVKDLEIANWLHYNEGAAGCTPHTRVNMLISNTSNSEPLMLDQLELGVDRYNCGYDLQDVGCQFRYRPVNKLEYAPRCTALTVFHIHTLSTDVVGYVTNVGRTTITRSGSKTLDFHLANNRGQSIRVTLWGGLGEMLIEKRTRHVGLYLIVLTAMSVKLYNNRLYLSSTSSTMIVDDEQIHVITQFKSDDSGIEIAKELLPVDSTGAKAGTLENLLMWARNRKYDVSCLPPHHRL
ncbi:SWI/SNF complex component SNF12 [Tanacetum coccineum]